MTEGWLVELMHCVGGKAEVAASIERHAELAASAARLLRSMPGFEVAVDPQSSIVCFRVDGSVAKQIVQRRRLTADGAFNVSIDTGEPSARRCSACNRACRAFRVMSLQQDREPAQIDIGQQADLEPRQFQYGALLVGPHGRSILRLARRAT